MTAPRPDAAGIDFKVLSEAAPAPGMTCVAIVRDEMGFMPHFLAHYRALGIGRFVFCDDGSSDGTREFLMRQPDCTVLATPHTFQEIMPDGQSFNYVARTAMAERFCPGEWYCHVDADEFLYLPARFATLPELTDHLDGRGEVCAAGAMVDLYPATLARRNEDGGPVGSGGLRFDRTPGFGRNPYTGEFEARMGGIRARLLQMLAERHPERVEELYPDGVVIAKLWKVPLRKSAPHIRQIDSHELTVAPPEDIQLALAHYRFHPGLDFKIADALARLNHWNASQEYKFLSAAVTHLGDADLVGPESVAFDGAASLEAAGLMFAHSAQAEPAPPAVRHAFGAPLAIERLGDIDGDCRLEAAIRAAHRDALGNGHPANQAWAADLADPRFHTGALQAAIDAAVRGAAALARQAGDCDDSSTGPEPGWSATAKALVLPSRAAGVRVAGQGRWLGAIFLHVEPGAGGLVSLTDLRAEGSRPSPADQQPANGAVPTTPVARGLMLLVPSWCAVTLAPWEGAEDGLRIAMILELSPKR